MAVALPVVQMHGRSLLLRLTSAGLINVCLTSSSCLSIPGCFVVTIFFQYSSDVRIFLPSEQVTSNLIRRGTMSFQLNASRRIGSPRRGRSGEAVFGRPSRSPRAPRACWLLPWGGEGTPTMKDDIAFTVHIFKEGDVCVAHASEFDVSSCGRTTEIARKNIRDAVQGFLETTNAMGTLVEVLEEAGYRLEAGRWRAPEFVALDRLSVGVG